MAGSYDDAPSRRLAYDADGTTAIGRLDSGWQPPATEGDPLLYPYALIGGTVLQELNDEDQVGAVLGHTSSWGGNLVVLIFPEKRDIDGYYAQYTHVGTSGQVEWLYYSTDTTNGRDGTWSSLGGEVFLSGLQTLEKYRDSITEPTSIPNVVAVAFCVNGFAGAGSESDGIMQFHLYGTLTAGETPDRLLYHTTGDAVWTGPKDYGDVARDASRDFTMKLKNNSGTKTANTIQVTGEDLYLGSGSWYTFSTDDITYYSTLNITSISAGSSQTVYVRQAVPYTATLGLHSARISTAVGSWT